MHDDLPDIALSIRQPWAWAILHAGKDVENRSWETLKRGPITLHAAAGMTLGEYRDCIGFMRSLGLSDLPSRADLDRGGIVGVARIVDCVTASGSRWFFGKFGIVLADVRPIPFIPAKGALGFFKWKGRVL